MVRALLVCLSFPIVFEPAKAENRLPTNGPELLYQLARFVEWPAGLLQNNDKSAGRTQSSQPEPFLIGLAGFDPSFENLRRGLEGRRLRGRPVIVRRASTLSDMRRSHVLFLGISERPHVRHMLAALRGANVLTVSAIPGFAQLGGMVEIAPQEFSRHLLAVNPAEVRRSGLGLNPSLLNVVSVARTESEPE
ncbi:MAG: YfiR family protein [Bryobacterales bacterium]|nr:YfiR family protein [Bryobacterales bacterium]